MTTPEKIETYTALRGDIKAVKDRGIPMRLRRGLVITPIEIAQLYELFTEPAGSKDKLSKSQILRVIKGKFRMMNICDKKDLRENAESFFVELPYAKVIPLETPPKPTPPERILSDRQLNEIKAAVNLSDKSNSVASSLLDPIDLSVKGMSGEVNTKNYKDELNHGFALPKALYKILKTLRYKESEKVLKDWLSNEFSKPNGESKAAVYVLQSLVNFTTFLDSKDWESILPQPYNALLSSVEYLRNQISSRSPHLRSLNEIENLIRFRFLAATRHTPQTSPSSFNHQDFATLAKSLVESHSNQNLPLVAKGIVNLAESVDADLEPLLCTAQKLHWTDFRTALVIEAQRQGRLEAPNIYHDALNVLREHPWRDAMQINNYHEIIRPKTKVIVIECLPGTYAPFHKGHKQNIVTDLENINNQKDQDQDLGIQRFLLVLPVTSISGVPNYQKKSEQIGPLGVRVAVMMLQLSEPEFDRNTVLITTLGQPIPSQASDLVGRVRHTANLLFGKMTASLAEAGLSAEFKLEIRHVMGADEIYRNPDGSIASIYQQPRKVIEEGGINVIRRGFLSKVIENSTDYRTNTGISTVILNSSIPDYSSTRIIKKIAEGSPITEIEPAARQIALDNWSPKAIESRKGIIPNVQPRSAGDIYRQLVEG